MRKNWIWCTRVADPIEILLPRNAEPIDRELTLGSVHWPGHFNGRARDASVIITGSFCPRADAVGRLFSQSRGN